MADRKNLSIRTNGEEHWLRRRRLGQTQAERAYQLMVSERFYNDVELDRKHIPIVVSVRLTLGERCTLARRRYKKPLRSMAVKFKISHTELLRRERESDDRLVAAWQRLGYIF